MHHRHLRPFLSRLLLLLAFIGAGCGFVAAEEGKGGCRDVRFREVAYVVCTFDPPKAELRLFHADALTGEAYGGFDGVSEALWRTHRFLVFAMNAGMYHADLSPVGLYVENGLERKGIVLSEGYGNFHLLPNGVFSFGDGKAQVREAKAFLASGERPQFATQSGPMLVMDGDLHPRFLPDSDSFKIRNGVGVSADGRVHFVLSDDRVRFYDFALFFRDELHCPNALYFDGTISGMLIPERQRKDDLYPMGPMVGVVERVPE